MQQKITPMKDAILPVAASHRDMNTFGEFAIEMVDETELEDGTTLVDNTMDRLLESLFSTIPTTLTDDDDNVK